jgi:predicted nicotinamide N-methyase
MGEEEAGGDERLPYWTEVWPSSVALCSLLRRMRGFIRGRPCIDLGCGLGLTAIVGRWLGARVLALDYEPEALRFAGGNARLNNVPPLGLALMDWRVPALKARCVPCLWGSDIMYERRFASPLLDFMEYVLAPGGRVWLAEPGRSVYEIFRPALRARGWAERCAHEQRVEAPAGAAPVTVRVWELTR